MLSTTNNNQNNEKLKILVVGGAGYIGAVTAKYLVEKGYEVLVYDHFSSHQGSKLGELPYVKGGILDQKKLAKTMSHFKPEVVMHFAAYIQMGESVRDPRKYYDNNFVGTLSLIETMIKVGCHKLVFASTAGVYGNVDPALAASIPETAAGYPTNPYGETKLAVERLLKWYDQAYGFKSISIRFFNAAGAFGEFGEDHRDESHIIPNIIKAQLEGREFALFGNDYQTKDGTCVRDYIHVLDLAEAFRLSAEKLVAGATTTTYNAGTGNGYSNKEIVEMVEKVASDFAQINPEHVEGSIKIKIKYAPRRPGDADILVADVSRIKAELGWAPQYSDLETIVKTAYQWHSN